MKPVSELIDFTGMKLSSGINKLMIDVVKEIEKEEADEN